MRLKIGALFAGYGGLDMAVMDTLDAELAWYAEWDKAPAKVMAHHHPDVPNLWDVTKVDWAALEPVGIITGGSPCQDLSHAGKRKGMTDGTRSNLWAEMREAIAIHRPRLVVWENVRGAGSAEATSAMEQCPRCVGDPRDRGPVLRALGRVVGDLADLGYVGRFYGLRAADVGGAHGRFRYFVCASPADTDVSGLEGLRGAAGASPTGRHGHPESGTGGPGLTLLPTPVSDNSRGLPSASTDYASLANVACDLFPTPRATDGTKGGPNQRGSSGDLMLPSAVHLLPTPTTTQRGPGCNLDTREGARANLHNEVMSLLPTPAVNDMGAAYTPDEWDEWTDRMKAAHGNGNGHGKSLAIEAQRLLPTPEAADGSGGRISTDLGGTRNSGAKRAITLATATHHAETAQDWRQYEAAIRRAEHATGRTAPAPTETGPKGKPRLSPAFVEWLMMLPAGHVTNPAIGLTRNEQLKALGNGVVPAQAAAALRAYLADEREAVA